MNPFAKIWRTVSSSKAPASSRRSFGNAIQDALSDNRWKILVAKSGQRVSILIVSDKAPQAHLLSDSGRWGAVKAIRNGEIIHLDLQKLRPSGLGRKVDGAPLLAWLVNNPDSLDDIAFRLPPNPEPLKTRLGALANYFELSLEPDLAPFSAPPDTADSIEDSAGIEPPEEVHWIEAADGIKMMLDAGEHRLFPHISGSRLCFVPCPAALCLSLSLVAPSDADIVRVARAAGSLDLIDPSFVGAAGDRIIPVRETDSILRCLAADPTRLLTLAGPAIVRADQAYAPSGEGPILPPPPSTASVARRRAVMLLGSRAAHLTPLLKILEDRDAPSTIPYAMQPIGNAEPVARRRSVMFLNHSYYNFAYLARELRVRGWDAVTVSLADPDSAQAKLYHGTDVQLFRPDMSQMVSETRTFLSEALDRFGIVHTYGKGAFSLFQHFWDTDNSHQSIPWDLLDFKRRGGLIGYSHSGCLDMVSQTSFDRWSGHMCRRCVWLERPDVCSDNGNLAWGWKVDAIADLISTDTEPGLDFKASPRSFRDPLTFAIDGEFWSPDLVPPDHLRREGQPGEVRVLHAVGNFRLRTKDGVNVKGTSAVVEAVDRLKAEGVPIVLDFAESVPSTEMRFLQVQADIIVDQLNYGRYGATAREGMMLGKPVVGRVLMTEPDGGPPSDCILETPIVDADESNIYDVLKRLAHDADLRREIGDASRRHALKWWAADVLAERFERVYDSVRDSGRPPQRLS